MRTKDKVSGAASNVKPYVERALKDDELRDNLKNAFDAAREVYSELLGPRPGAVGLATRVATDKDIQEHLRTAIEELRTAADRVQGRESHKGRNTMLLMTGIALGILFNPLTGPDTRRWLRDTLFGGGDDFGYSGSGSGGSTSGNNSGAGSSSDTES